MSKETDSVKTTRFNKIDCDWVQVKNHCRTTVSKQFTSTVPSEEFKRKLLISEHSPIRAITVDWTWEDIKYWVSTEWSRHKFEKFISSQRNDRQEKYDRNKAPQDALVMFDGIANMQNLIDAWRKRLCYCATAEARELAESFKHELHKKFPELADALVPNCVYRCGCPEFTNCGFFKGLRLKLSEQEVPTLDILDIQKRYDAYNSQFYKD